MSNFTDIEFLEIDSKVDLLADGVAAMLNFKYPAVTVINVQKKNPNDVGTPFAKLKYRVYKDDLVSNISTVQINLSTNPGSPNGENYEDDVNQNEVLNLESFIDINQSSDRILIRDFDLFAGKLSLDGTQLLYPNDEIVKYDFYRLKFETYSGTGEPYQKIYFSAANESVTSGVINYIAFNILGLAEYKNESYTTELNEGVISRFLISKLTNGRINKKALFSIEINLDEATAWPEGNNNEIVISANGFNKRYTENISEEFEILIDDRGNSGLQADISFVQDNLADITGTLEIKLLKIDNDEDLVSPTENTININFTT
jgi:hypothetical protein